MKTVKTRNFKAFFRRKESAFSLISAKHCNSLGLIYAKTG